MRALKIIGKIFLGIIGLIAIYCAAGSTLYTKTSENVEVKIRGLGYNKELYGDSEKGLTVVPVDIYNHTKKYADIYLEGCYGIKEEFKKTKQSIDLITKTYPSWFPLNKEHTSKQLFELCNKKM